MEGESVHVNKFETIFKNVNDGDNHVYEHDDAKTTADVNRTYSSTNTGAGGKDIGELGCKIDVDNIYSNVLARDSKEAKAMWNPLSFYKDVKTGGKWDLKNDKNSIFGLGNDGKTTFLFQGKSMESQDIGNHHFGVVGEAYGLFSKTFMLQQAGDYQIKSRTSDPAWIMHAPTQVNSFYGTTSGGEMLPPYGDDPRDQSWIKSGFDYSDKH